MNRLYFLGILCFVGGTTAGCSSPQYAGETHAVNLDDPVRYELSYIDVALRAGKSDEVRKAYVSRLHAAPADPLAHVLYGRTLGDDKAAFDQYSKAVELDPDNYWAQLSLGEVYGRMDAHDRAITALERAAALRPRFAFAHAALGDVWRRKGDTKAAKAAYQGAIDLDPHNLVAHRGLGELHLSAGEDDEALAPLALASRMDPDDVELHLKVARLQEKSGATAEAHAHYRAATEVKDDDPQAWYGRARTARAAAMQDDAVASLERVLALKSYHHLARRDLADLLRERGEHARALTLYRDAVKATPGDLDAHRGLGLAAEGTGAWLDALEAFARTRELAPQDVGAAKGLGRVTAALGMTAAPVSGASLTQVTDRARLQAMGCIDKIRSSRPEFTGRLLATATVDAKGRTTDVKLDEDTIRSPELEACVIWTLRTAQWPKGNAATAPLVLDLTAAAGADGPGDSK